MTGRNQERSDRIVAAATRVIDLTAQIDATLDQADTLAEERRHALEELTRLADVTVGAYPTPPVSYARSVAETALLVLMLVGKEGITEGELARSVGSRLGSEVPGDEIGKALAGLVERGDVLVEGASCYAAHMRRRPVLRRRGSPTIGQLITEVLQDAGRPLSVTAIREGMIQRGHTYPRSSIQPILPRLQRAGIVAHVGRTWNFIPDT